MVFYLPATKEALMRYALSDFKSVIFTKLALLLPVAVILVSCGGGGGTSNSTTPPVLASSSSLAKQCVAPRASTADRSGSLDSEKAWIRSFMDETYLWYKDV
ncbi:MAG: hypothetical protein WB821_16725, partial [Burkholderiaceae bacterium]